MSDLDVKLTDLINAFVFDIRDISTAITGVATQGNAAVVSGLNTASKNLVGGINDLVAEVAALDTSKVAESSNLYFTDSRVLGVALNGFVAQAGTVQPTDSILQVLQKLDGNINNVDLSSIIDDSAASANTAYSSTKTQEIITAQIAAALEGEDLSDIASQIAANIASLGGVVSFDSVQALTSAQKTQAQKNMGFGDLESFDPVALYTSTRTA